MKFIEANGKFSLFTLVAFAFSLTCAMAEDKKCNPKMEVTCPTYIRVGLGTGAIGATPKDPDDPSSKDTDDRLLVKAKAMENCQNCVISVKASWTEGSGAIKAKKEDISEQIPVQPNNEMDVKGLAKQAPEGAHVNFEVTLKCDGEEKGEKKQCWVFVLH